jgi:hypothetical protein
LGNTHKAEALRDKDVVEIHEQARLKPTIG